MRSKRCAMQNQGITLNQNHPLPALLLAPFFARSFDSCFSFFAPTPDRSACYAGYSSNSHRLGAVGSHGRRHGSVEGRCACEIIYGSPERQKKILFGRLFSRNNKINPLTEVKENQYLTASGIKSFQKQTVGNNRPVCMTDRPNVRAAEIRFAQLKEGKPLMLFNESQLKGHVSQNHELIGIVQPVNTLQFMLQLRGRRSRKSSVRDSLLHSRFQSRHVVGEERCVTTLRLQNSPYIFTYSSTCKQSNKRSGTRRKTIGLLRHALPICLRIWREKTDCFAVQKTLKTAVQQTM